MYYIFTFFVYSVRRLSNKLINEQEKNPNASLSFDKDDPDALDFVTATSNLRSIIFGIEEKSQFKVKGIQKLKLMYKLMQNVTYRIIRCNSRNGW